MIQGLIGIKVGMSQSFDAEGNVIPVTVIKAGPCTVIQKKTAEKDGYAAVQLGFVEERAVRKPLKPQIGHFKKAGVPVVRKLQEFGCSDPAAVKEGDQVLVDIFEIGETIHVVGTSKGKGFAGVVKRHHFAGAAFLTRTYPPLAPGTAPLTMRRFWSLSVATTLSLRTVTRSWPMWPPMRMPLTTREG